MPTLSISKAILSFLVGGVTISTPIAGVVLLTRAISIDKLAHSQELSLAQLKANSCEVLVNSIDKKSQILVCLDPSKVSSVGFLFLKEIGNNQIEVKKIEKFSKSISSWETTKYVYNLQLAFEGDRQVAKNQIKISEDKHNALDQLEKVELSSCRLDTTSKQLSCRYKETNSFQSFVHIELVKGQDYLIKS